MKRAIALIFITLWPSVSMANWQARASVETSVEDNVFRNSDNERDIVSETTLSLTRTWAWKPWSAAISYEGSYVGFMDHGSHDYLFHQAGLSMQRNLEHDGFLRGGFRTAMRSDGDAYELYDYREYQLFFDAKLPVNDQLTVFAGYHLRQRAYDELDELDNIEHRLYARLRHTSPKGLTLTLSSELGFKSYQTTDGSESIITGSGSHSRKIVTTASNENTLTAGQWIKELNATRPIIDEKTGLRLSVVHRSNFGDRAMAISGLNADQYTETDLFDDPYSYESLELRGMVSRVLPYGVTARIGYDYANKEYQEAALDSIGDPLPGEPVRRDRQYSLWARMEKSFTLNAWHANLNLYGQYRHIRNSSNDTYYDYRATSFTAGAELNF